MNAFAYAAITNVFILIAIAIACYATESGWPVLAMIFLIDAEVRTDAPTPVDDRRL